MKIRKLIRLNKVTPEEIKELRNNTGFGFTTCKEMLESKLEFLQYLDDEKGGWVDVPTVTSYRESVE